MHTILKILISFLSLILMIKNHPLYSSDVYDDIWLGEEVKRVLDKENSVTTDDVVDFVYNLGQKAVQAQNGKLAQFVQGIIEGRSKIIPVDFDLLPTESQYDKMATTAFVTEGLRWQLQEDPKDMEKVWTNRLNDPELKEFGDSDLVTIYRTVEKCYLLAQSIVDCYTVMGREIEKKQVAGDLKGLLSSFLSKLTSLEELPNALCSFFEKSLLYLKKEPYLPESNIKEVKKKSYDLSASLLTTVLTYYYTGQMIGPDYTGQRVKGADIWNDPSSCFHYFSSFATYPRTGKVLTPPLVIQQLQSLGKGLSLHPFTLHKITHAKENDETVVSSVVYLFFPEKYKKDESVLNIVEDFHRVLVIPRQNNKTPLFALQSHDDAFCVINENFSGKDRSVIEDFLQQTKLKEILKNNMVIRPDDIPLFFYKNPDNQERIQI